MASTSFASMLLAEPKARGWELDHFGDLEIARSFRGPMHSTASSHDASPDSERVSAYGTAARPERSSELNQLELTEVLEVSVSREEGELMLECHRCDPKVVARDGCALAAKLPEQTRVVTNALLRGM